MSEQQVENKKMATVGIVLAAISLLICWIPGFNVFGLVMTAVALVFTLISFYINRGKKKTTTFVSLGLTIASALFSLVMIFAFVSVVNDDAPKATSELKTESKVSQKASSKKSARSNSDFEAVLKARVEREAKKAAKDELGEDVTVKNTHVDLSKDASSWSKTAYGNLKVAKSQDDEGTTLAQVEKNFGKPTLTMDVVSQDGMTLRTMTWIAEDDDEDSVTLVFFKQDDGSWLLIEKEMNKLEI